MDVDDVGGTALLGSPVMRTGALGSGFEQPAPPSATSTEQATIVAVRRGLVMRKLWSLDTSDGNFGRDGQRHHGVKNGFQIPASSAIISWTDGRPLHAWVRATAIAARLLMKTAS